MGGKWRQRTKQRKPTSIQQHPTAPPQGLPKRKVSRRFETTLAEAEYASRAGDVLRFSFPGVFKGWWICQRFQADACSGFLTPSVRAVLIYGVGGLEKCAQPPVEFGDEVCAYFGLSRASVSSRT